MPISLGFWEWGCPKRGDAHITVTLVCQVGGSLFRLSDNRARKKNSRTKKKKKRAEPERLEQAKREATGSNPGRTNTQGL